MVIVWVNAVQRWLVLIARRGAVCHSGLPYRDDIQSWCPNLVTLEIVTTVLWLADKITLKKDGASKEMGVCKMDGLMGMEKPCGGIVFKSAAIDLLFCHFMKKYCFSLPFS